MKNNFLKTSVVLILLLTGYIKSDAQVVQSMPFSFAPGAPSSAAVTGSILNLALRAQAVRDEWDTIIAPGGWNFKFAGVTYTNFIVSTNCWIALAPSTQTTVPAYFASPLPNNSLATYAGGLPFIAPLWDDDSTSIIQYGVAANVLTVKWTLKWDKTYIGTYSAPVWVTLDGNTGVITFHYSTGVYAQGASAGASIGIAGVCPGDYYSVSPNATHASSTVSTTTENSTVVLKPNNAKFTFTPLCSNDNCAGATFMGTVGATCTNALATTVNATPGGTGNCGSTDDDDVWFTYLKPAGVTGVKFTTSPGSCGSVPSGTSIEVWDGCGGTMVGCSMTGTTYPAYGEITVTRSGCVAETLYVRVTSDGDNPGTFNICAQNSSVATGTTCANPTVVCLPVPYSTTGTTQGSVNNYNDSVLCQSDWMTGQDYVYMINPTTTACYNIILSGTGVNSYPGLFLFDGCPNDTDFSSCVATAQNQSNGDSIMNITLSGGHAYYLVIDNNSTSTGTNGVTFMPYNLNITASGSSSPPNDPCGGAASLGAVNFNQGCTWSSTFSTQCATPSPVGGYPNPVCGNFSPALTNDVWFTFNPTFAGTILISSQGAGTNPVTHGGFAVYTGTCGLLNLVGCAGDSVGIPYLPSLSLAVTNQVYYLRFWSATYLDPGSFQLCFQSNCAPPNDLPVNSVALPLATPMIGDNTCSTGSAEMANPIDCPTGTVNTVWYKIIVPPSGQLAVRISQLSLLDAALAAFTFPTGPANAASSFTRIACNDDIIFAPPCPICGMSGDNDAAIQFTATPGSTVYVAVDGEAGAVGSFYITAIEGTLSSTFPPVYRKDCGNPEIICANNNYYMPNGGIGSDGNICDFTNLACAGGATTSEVGSTWLQFTVSPGSTLGFTITPNDSASPVANYNFYLWDITGVNNFCNQISTLPITRCNTVAGTGKTGLRAPAAGQFSNTIASFAVPHTYMLFVQNLTSANDDEGVPGTNTGFTLDWAIYSGGVPIGMTALAGTSPSSIWSGTVVDTNYQYLPNWKGVGTCPAALPNCTTDVFISGATKQCWVMGNSYCKNMTINAGGTLRIFAGANLHVCGNYLNNGTLIADLGSTITFEGPATQTVAGALTGANAFASIVINKGAGTGVDSLLANLDVKENFTTASATSIFSINGKYMKVGGNFTNSSGTVTFKNIGGSTVEFNGAIRQDFTNNSGSINLNRVFMNKALDKLYLMGPSSTMNIDTLLNLTNGNIVTTPTLEVNVKYGIPGAVINHNVNSYIDGRLRRRLYLGSIDWPLGDSLVPAQGASKGYELANITFTSSTVVPDLLAWFNIWQTPPPPNGPAAFDFCGTYTTQYNSPIFDNGYWAFQRTAPNFNGAYNVTLYNTGGTNTGGGVAWSVGTAALAANVNLLASWSLLGTCNPASTAAITKRNTFNSPAGAGGSTSFNQLYATVQASVILPIELLYFTAEPKGEDVICNWETATEKNNDFFDVERSIDGKEYVAIGRVKGYGAGVSTENRKYSLADHDPCEEIRYYRLKQVDIDGQFSYSDPVAINCVAGRNEVKVYPNPANTILFSTFFEQKDGVVSLQWIDIVGKVVKEETHDVIKGYNTIRSDISDMTQGIYYLQLRNNNSDSVDGDRRIRFMKN